MNFIDDFLKTIQKDSPNNEGINYYCKHLKRYIVLRDEFTECDICIKEIKEKYAKNKNK